MPIRLKRSTSSNDEFYPLNENSTSDGNKAGNGVNKEVRSKLTQFSKNILKSTKNLAFNVVDTYAPNVKEVKNSFKEAGSAAKEDFDKSFGGMISSAKKLVTGSNGEGVKKRLNNEIKDIKNRLKTGRLYTSAEDDMEESMNSQFGDFSSNDFSFGDDFNTGSDSFTTVSEPDSLSQEPFGGVKKGRTRRVNVSSKQRQIRQSSTRMHSSKPRVSKSGGGIRAGDELVSGVTQSVGQSVIIKQEEVWARTYEANKKNFERLYGYQNTIMKGVNSMVEFNNNVISKNIQAQLEFQGKMLAAQQDALAHFKEIKDAVLVTSTYKPVERSQTLRSKIANNSVGFDGKSYWENVKRNLGDVAGSNPILSLFMSGPGMMDMLSMSEDTGMKVVNPLNLLTGSLVNGLISKTTRNKYRDFNEILSNFGGAFMGRMNMLRDYGKTDIAKTIGKIFGSQTTFVKETDNGMAEKDLNAVVGWTGKSDRTLNEVIPTLLAKQLAALTGNEERTYDYHSGQFVKVSAVNKTFEKRLSAVFKDPESATMMDSMTSSFRQMLNKSKDKNFKKEYKDFDDAKIKSNIDKMRQNLVKSGKPFDPNQIANKDYTDMLTQGIAEKEKDPSLKMLLRIFNGMRTQEQIRWNNSITRISANYQQNIREASRYYKVFGGSGVIAEKQSNKQLENIKRILDEDPRYKLTDEDARAIKSKTPNNTLTSKLARRAKLLQEFELINGSADNGYSEEELKKDSKIGIEYDLEKTMETFSVSNYIRSRKQEVGRQSILEMLSPVGGTSILSQNNVINKGFNAAADAGMGMYKKFFGYGESGPGLDGALSYSQMSLDQNEATINGLKDQKKKLQEFIKEHPGTKRAEAAAKTIKVIDGKVISLYKIRKQLKKGGTDTKFVNDSSSLGKFFGGLENIYDSFVNDKVIDNGTDKSFNKEEATAFAKNSYKEFKDYAKDSKTKLGMAIKTGKTNVKDAGAAISLYKESIKNGKSPDEAKAEIKELVEDNAVADAIITAANKTLNVGGTVKTKATKVKNKVTETYSKTDRNLVETVQSLATEFSQNAETTAEEAWDKAVDSVRKQLDKHPDAKKIVEDGKSIFLKGIKGVKSTTKKTKGKVEEVLSKEENAKLANFISQAEGLAKTTGMAIDEAYHVVAEGVKDQLSKLPKVAKHFKQFANSAKRRVKNKLAGSFLPNNVDLGGANFKKGGTKAGTLIGGTLGIFGGPLGMAAGAAAGGTIGRLIGGRFQKRRFQTIRSPLVAMGYIDAATMKPKELYALANSVRGAKGNAIRALDEFEVLKKVAYANPLGKAGEVLAKPFKALQRGGKIALMTMRGTLPYKNLVDSLDQVLNANRPRSERTSVYTMDKYMLYASINALSERTKDEKNVKRALMGTKDYKKLANNVEKGESWLHSTIKEKITNIKRGINRLHHFKYRFLINFLKGQGPEYAGIEDVKDPNEIYLMLDSFGKKRKNRKTFEILKRSKAYLNLELAVKSKGLKREQRRELRKSLKRGHAVRRKFATIISILRANGMPVENDDKPAEIYLQVLSLFEKKEKSNPELVNAIKRTSQYKALARAAGQKPLDAKNTYTKKQNLFQRAFSGIKKFFGRNKPDYENATNELDYDLARKNRRSIKKLQRAHWWGRRLDETNADVIEGTVGEATHRSLIDRGREGVAGWASVISKATQDTAKKLSGKVKDRKDDNMAEAGKTAYSRTKNLNTALLASIGAGVAGFSKTLAKFSKFMGMNDKGELDEKNKETGIGRLHEDIKNVEKNGGGKKKKDKNRNWKDWLGVGTGLLGIAALAGTAIYGAKKNIDTIKEKDLNAGEAAGLLSGVDSQYIDQDKWFNVQKAGNAWNIAKNSVALRNAGKSVVKHGKKIVQKPLEQLTKGINKILSNPKVVKKIGEKNSKKLQQILTGKIVQRAGKQAGKKAVKDSTKQIPVWGWIIAAIDAVKSFAEGLNDAPKYFKVSPNDTSAGMRTTSGLVKMIKSIITSLASFIPGVGLLLSVGIDLIIPDAWLVTEIYNLIASDEDKAELERNQKEQDERAKALGTDAKSLSEAENRSIWSKATMGVQAAFSDKTYDEIKKERIAKDLNMSVEDYERLNGEYQDTKAAKFAEKYPEFGKIKSPKDAAKAFKDPEKRSKLEQEAQAMFNSNDYEAIKTVNQRINEKKYGSQNRNKKFLTDSFKSKVESFLKDDDVKHYNLNAIETVRNPFTQFAYYSKGRANDKFADYILKLAGFKSGLNYWGGDNRQNTKTLGSAHLGGNAIDFSIKNLSNADLAKIGKAADKYGIEWGGNWSNLYDPPHFQDKTDKTDPTQAFAKGGLVKNPTKINYLEDFGDKISTRLNPGEMVLTKSQQYSLFNKIKKYEHQEIAGTTTNNPVRLNESPYISNAREDVVLINQVLDIQNKIYQEQTRHNKIAEEFFSMLISLVGGKLNAPKGPRIIEQQNKMSDDLINGAYDNASGL